MISELDINDLLDQISNLEFDLDIVTIEKEELISENESLRIENEDLKNRLSEIYSITRDVV